MIHDPPPGLHADAGHASADDPVKDAAEAQEATDTKSTKDTGDTHGATSVPNTRTPAGTPAPTGLGGGAIPYVARAPTVKAETATDNASGAAKSQETTHNRVEWTRIMHPDDVGKFVQEATQMAGFLEAQQQPVDTGIQVKIALRVTSDTITKNFDDLYDREPRTPKDAHQTEQATDMDARSDSRSEPRWKYQRTSRSRRSERSPPPSEHSPAPTVEYPDDKRAERDEDKDSDDSDARTSDADSTDTLDATRTSKTVDKELEIWAERTGVRMTPPLWFHLTRWEGHGREYAKENMPFSDNADEQRAILKDWDTRMRDKTYLRQVRGWVQTTRTHQGQYRFLSRHAQDRGRALREFFKLSGVNVPTQTMLCGLITRYLDKFLNGLMPKHIRTTRELQDRIAMYVAKKESDTHEDAIGWYDDRRAPSFSWHKWDVRRLLGAQGEYGSAGSHDEWREQKRQDYYDYDYDERQDKGADYAPTWGQEEAQTQHDEWYDPRQHAEAPRKYAPTNKGYLNEPKYTLVRDRTAYFDDALVAQMDERNHKYMSCLDHWVQRDVVHTYAPRDEKEIKDVNKYLGAVIGSFHRMAQSGLEPAESARRIALSQAGYRMKYHTCYSYGYYGTCRYDRHCKQVHITDVCETK